MLTIVRSRLAPIGLATALLSVGCIAICTSSCGIPGNGIEASETRDPGGFAAVAASGALDVLVTSGKPHAVLVRGDENLLPYVTTEVHGDRLVLGTSHSVRPRRKLVVEVALPQLHALSASGATDIAVTGIDAASLDVDSSGASDVRLEGRTDRLILDASGAADVDASRLSSIRAEIDSHGAAGVIVSVADHLRARASGASEILYSGDGVTVDADASGAASVARR